MAFDDLINHPKQIGWYHTFPPVPKYDLDVPVKGQPLQYDLLGVVSLADAQATMEARKLAFDTNQSISLFNPTTWINIGFVVDSVDGSITAYYQYLPAQYSFDPQVWDNFPDTPEDYKPA